MKTAKSFCSAELNLRNGGEEAVNGFDIIHSRLIKTKINSKRSEKN